VIIASDLTKFYGDKPAVMGVNFKIGKGEAVGFLGLNGAGKTTVLRMMAGDLLPSGGRIQIDGQDLAERPRRLGTWVGFLPENPPIYPAMKVSEYLYYLGRLRGLGRSSAKSAVLGAVEKTGLSQVVEQTADTLSHGFKKRLGIAQAIVHGPKLVILDEPTSGLDPVQIVEMRFLIQRLASDRTILLSSHHLAEVRETCSRFILLKDGAVVAEGTEDELASRLTSAGAINITVKGSMEKAKEALTKLDGIEDIRFDQGQGQQININVSTSKDIRAEAARALVGAGLDLLGLAKAGDDLEEVFLKVTRDTQGEVQGHA